MQRLSLSIALSDNQRTRPVARGAVMAQGIDFISTVLHPSEMFWRQLKYGDFDVSEMSLSSLLISTAKGDRTWVALPIFTSREFFHTRILVRTDSGIETPKDLIGKKVGVPEYQQTAAVWSRGVLQREFSVRPTDISWFMERPSSKSHGGATGFKPPENIALAQIPQTTSIGKMLCEGELDATLLYLNAPNLVDRSTADLNLTGIIRPLFRDQAGEKRRYYRKTGIFPINHAVVIRRDLYEQHPWIALNIYHAFSEAKAHIEKERLDTLKPYLETGLLDIEAQNDLNLDPMPYGVAANRQVLETVSSYVREQGLTDRTVALNELFVPATMVL